MIGSPGSKDVAARNVSMLCDIDADGFVWNTLQQRRKLDVNFDRDDAEYKCGLHVFRSTESFGH